MKDFHCRDAGMSCDFVAKGDSKQEILDQVARHAQEAHHMTVVLGPLRLAKVEGLIHEESSEAHRKSMSAGHSP